jgi:CRISPR-associated endonuclease/helicase Cas3
LIEAGVDVDFDVVIRSIIGLDSCAQSAGRCNRDAKRERGSLIIINPAKGLERLSGMGDLVMGQKIAEQTLRNSNDLDPLSNQQLRQFSSQFFGDLNETRGEGYLNYRVEISNVPTDLVLALSSNTALLPRPKRREYSGDYSFYQAFDSGSRYYHPINEDTMSVIVPYGDGENILAELNDMQPQIDHDWERWNACLSKAKAYMVSVPRQSVRKYLKSGTIYSIKDGIDIFALVPGFYDDFLGFGPKSEESTQSFYA